MAEGEKHGSEYSAHVSRHWHMPLLPLLHSRGELYDSHMVAVHCFNAMSQAMWDGSLRQYATIAAQHARSPSVWSGNAGGLAQVLHTSLSRGKGHSLHALKHTATVSKSASEDPPVTAAVAAALKHRLPQSAMLRPDSCRTFRATIASPAAHPESRLHSSNAAWHCGQPLLSGGGWLMHVVE